MLRLDDERPAPGGAIGMGWSRTSRAGAAAALVVAAGLLTGPQATASPAVACGDTLTVDTVLTHDLTCGAGAGLRVLGGVTLDLGGHTLRGPGRGDGVHTTAVALTVDHLSSPGAVTLRHGTIEGWDVAVESTEQWGTEAVVQGVTFRGMYQALTEWLGRYTVESSTFEDVVSGVGPSQGSITVARSRFVGGQIAIGGNTNGHVVVTDSVVTGSTVAGIDCDTGELTLTRSVLTGNRTALRSTLCTVRADRAVLAGNGTGVHVHSSTPWASEVVRVARSTFTGNTTAVLAEGTTELVANRFVGNGSGVRTALPPSSPGEGTVTLERNTFVRNGDAVYLELPAWLRANRVLHSTGHGIYAPLATDLGGNVAVGNGVEPQCTGVVCHGS